MKIIANFTDPYSILNPDTSSDSPSAKSKGVRFNSATHVITQGSKIKNKGPTIKSNPPLTQPLDNAGPSQNTIKLIRTNASLISYAIVWAAARRPPNKAYFLFDPHPDPNKGYTFRLKSIIKKNTDSRVMLPPLLLFRSTLNLTIRNKARTGLMK